MDNLGRNDTNNLTVNLPNVLAFQYDLNGNLTNDGSRSFAYDDENQLISVVVTNATGVVTRSDFAYDGFMRRRTRVELALGTSGWLTNQTVRYIYDGSVVIQERDGNNLPVVTYTHGIDQGGGLDSAGGIGGFLARTDHSQLVVSASGAHSYYHCDGNGNVTCLINTNQSVVARYLYDPFGSVISKSGPLADANLYRFSSKEFHLPSGLLSYQRRYYDPGLQRWINRDPLSEAGGLNLYQFALNNPVGAFDPLGLCDPSLLNLFLHNVSDNWFDDTLNYFSGIGQGAEGLATSLYNFGKDPFGAVANAASFAGTVSTDLPGFAADFGHNLLNSLETPQGIGKAVFGVELGLATAGVAAGPAAAEGAPLSFSQTTASPWFSAEGNFAGQTISDVAGQLRAGTLTPAQVPVQVVTMDGNTLIVNTRSSLALSQAGIPQSSWNLIDMTGNESVVNSISAR